ncbi:MAG: hypothetical protein LBG88_01170 [Christensenellaceae bacterium]|jgi:hypothetical protein|nr:hypothetical protein [Christensenellaceae bacterium]
MVKTQSQVLAQMYGCAESELLAKYDRMTSEIKTSAIVTLNSININVMDDMTVMV